MFKLQASNDFTWPVEINVPVDGGRTQRHTMNVVFRSLPLDELGRFYADNAAWAGILAGLGRRAPDEGDDAAPAEDPLIARQVIVDWPNGAVQDEDGKPVPFSREAATKLLQISYVRAAVIQAYQKAMAGDEVKSKN